MCTQQKKTNNKKLSLLRCFLCVKSGRVKAPFICPLFQAKTFGKD